MQRRHDVGLTLVELLVAVSLIGLLAVTVTGAFFVGHRSVRGMADGLDQNQQLRAAIKVMTDDMAFSRWVANDTLDYSDVHCTPTGCAFSILAYQPKVSPTASFPDWVGDTLVRIRYRLENGDLIREVYEYSYPPSNRVYSSRILLSGLLPYSKAGTGSLFRLEDTGLVKVVLRMPLTVGGSTNAPQVSTVFYMR